MMTCPSAAVPKGSPLRRDRGVPAGTGIVTEPVTCPSPDARMTAVKGAQGSDFFNLVRGQCITSIYNNEMAWAHFGYQGASWPQGGYLHRGFADLTWLPNPPLDASPKPWA